MYGQGAVWGLKLIAPLIRAYHAWQSLQAKWRRKLIFVRKAHSGWVANEGYGQRVVHLHAPFTVTHQERDAGVLVGRVQVRRGAFAFWRDLEDCDFCDIGGERVMPISPGVVIKPRMASLMEVRHPFRVETLPSRRTKRLSFLIVATDQFDNRHCKRVRLPRLGMPS